MFRIPESDWMVLRELKQELLDSACEGMFQRIDELAAAREGREYDALQDVRKFVESEDRRLSVMFDEMKPSTALVKIMNLCKAGFINEQQFGRFSSQTRDRVVALLHDRRG